MKIQPKHAALAVALLAATATLASAGDHGREREQGEREQHEEHEGREARGRSERAGRGATASAAAIDPTYAKECGACHLAYPPSLLPAAGWRGVMAGLDRHFGVDAALDEPARARVEAWLVAGAGPDRGAAVGDPSRISGQRWFVREHREVPAGAIARPAIKSWANCQACHAGAAGWDFDEDRVKIPRG
ncbi:MAG: diheme cytochrome c [Anaeromyxobacter sp.]